jgi:transcription antitermination protein NusB
MSRKPASIGRQRHAARIAAVQALYQMELSGGDPDEVIAEFVAYRLRDEAAQAAIDLDLFTDLVRGVTAARAETDALIGEALDKDRSIGRLEVLMRAILRAGAYELTARDDIDAALTISEYVAVADAFFNEREPALVNAVLDRIARSLAGRSSPAGAAHDIAQDG